MRFSCVLQSRHDRCPNSMRTTSVLDATPFDPCCSTHKPINTSGCLPMLCGAAGRPRNHTLERRPRSLTEARSLSLHYDDARQGDVHRRLQRKPASVGTASITLAMVEECVLKLSKFPQTLADRPIDSPDRNMGPNPDFDGAMRAR